MDGPRKRTDDGAVGDDGSAGRLPITPPTGRRDLLRALGGGAVTLATGVGTGAGTVAADRSGDGGVDGGSSLAAGSADTQTFEPLGSLDLRGTREAVVSDDGRIAYVAVNDGFATVDVSDPASPELLAEVRGVPESRSESLQSVHDVKVDGDRVVVPGPAQSGSLRGFQLFDVSDPADPVPVGDFYETRFGIHNCAFDDGVVYLTGNFAGGSNDLVIVDAADDDPTEAGRWSLLDYDDGWSEIPLLHRVLHDVSVQDGTAYCARWDAGTWLVDVSDPTAPAHVGHVADHSLAELRELVGASPSNEVYLQPPGNAHYVTVNDDATLMGVGVEAWDTTPDDPDAGGPGGITLYDISDPTAPAKLSFIEPNRSDDESYASGTWSTAHNFELRDGVAYTSWYQDGVRVYDVSEPTSPTELAGWRDPETAAFWTAQVGVPGEYFVASSAANLPNGAPTDDRLYTFPDRFADAGGSGPTPTATATSTATSTPTATPTATPTTTPTATPTSTLTTGGGTTTGGDGESQGGGLDGFGVGAAVGAAAVALGAWRRLRGEDR